MAETKDARFKLYVQVGVEFMTLTDPVPRWIVMRNGKRYEIERVLKRVLRASSKVGGSGIRYTVQINGKETYLYDEENGRWFVEAKTTEATGA